MSNKDTIQKTLSLGDIKINGAHPWDIQVHNERLYGRVLAQGSLGLGESYMDGWWDSEKLDEFFNKILRACLDKKVKLNAKVILNALYARLVNLQSVKRAFQIGAKHYGIGNDLFERMLDSRLAYSCGYWNPSASSGLKRSANLDEAQENKLDLICKKLGLKKGMKILDIGCGWGGFVKFAAERYGVEAVGITVSKEQAEFAKKKCQGLPIEIKLQDYRSVSGVFDRVISVGMIEHVGHKNYRTYMRVVERVLKDDGLFLLHAIGKDESVASTNPWIEKYIFPNSMLPSSAQLTLAFDMIFVMEDWHNFGHDYDRTLMAWFENFNKTWSEIAEKYGERFYRMWKYYLLSCAGAFRARKIQLWQIVLSKNGVPGGYTSIR